MPPAIATNLHHTIGGNNLNINLPDNNTGVLRLEVELRDKNARRRPNNHRHKGFAGNRAASPVNGAVHQTPPNPNSFFIPMEKVRISLIVLHFVFFLSFLCHFEQ